jgi:hypothetical protein
VRPAWTTYPPSAQRATGVGIEPRGQIERDHAPRAGDRRAQSIGVRFVQCSVRARAEHGVDDEIRGPRRRPVDEMNSGAGQAIERGARRAGEPRSVGHEPHFDVRATLGEQARDDESVAAVIALPAHDVHAIAALRAEVLLDRERGARACALHERPDRRARRDRARIGGAHLGGGEHEHPVARAHPGRFPGDSPGGRGARGPDGSAVTTGALVSSGRPFSLSTMSSSSIRSSMSKSAPDSPVPNVSP